MIKFSVLMSIYFRDNPSELKEALSSLAIQTLPADQVVLVFDGSVGKDLERVVESFSDKLPLKCIQLKKNIGLGNALNAGLKSCRNEWVFRMDSDDICRKDRFAEQIEVIRTNPNIDVTGGVIAEFIDAGETLNLRTVPLSDFEIKKAIKRYSPFNHVTVGFRKSTVESVGGYVGGKNYQEDYLLWLKLASSGATFHNLNSILVDVRVGDNMLTRRGGLDYFVKEMKVAYFGVKLGVIPWSIFLINTCFKFVLRLSPLFVRRFIYRAARHLRK